MKKKRKEFVCEVRKELDRRIASSDVQESWNRLQESLIMAAEKVVGRTKGGKRIDKDTWWWNEKVQEVIKRKKRAFKELSRNGSTLEPL